MELTTTDSEFIYPASKLKPAATGVPQGSKLGRSYSLYIFSNDLSATANNCLLDQYADGSVPPRCPLNNLDELMRNTQQILIQKYFEKKWFQIKSE